MILIFLSLLLTLFCTVCVTTTNEDTLKLMHVVFRHGDRTPDPNSLYPKDPNSNDTWYPIGYGQLTNLGKRMEFNIGKQLRTRYGTFLGTTYTMDLLEPTSTEYNRTRMSLELVLAGLFPPNILQTWNPDLPWQPIPYNYVDSTTNPELSFSLLYCPAYTELFKKLERTEEFAQFLKDNEHLINYIQEHSGLNVTDYLSLGGLYFDFVTEISTGRKIPEWGHRVYPDFLTNATILYYKMLVYNSELVRLSSGSHLLKTILTHAELKMSNTLQPESRKLFLYSGHEYNIAYLLGALNVFKPEIPPYASYVVVELHNVNETYGFKILYHDGPYSEPKYLTIPGCQSFCPFNKTVSLLKDNIPSSNNACSQ